MYAFALHRLRKSKAAHFYETLEARIRSATFICHDDGLEAIAQSNVNNLISKTCIEIEEDVRHTN